MDSKPSYEALLEKINQLETENLRLRSEAVKYRTLFDAFPHGISVSNEQGDILETNDIAEKLLGVGKQDHEGRAIDGQEWRIVRPDGTDLPPSQWASVIALKENTLVSNSEIGIVKPDGTTVWLNVTAAPLSLPGHGVVITYSDITARKIMENEQKTTQHELLKRNQFIEAILDHMPIGLGLNDIDTGEVTYLNKKWEEIYGWGKDAFPTVLDFFEKVFPDPTVRSTLQARIMNDIASGDPDRMIWEDLEIATAQGDKRIVHARNIPLVEQNLMISTVQDVTEKRKLQAQLHQAQKLEAVGTLAGGIAHDFNNLLGVIIGNISYALGLVDTSDELYDVLSEVQGVSKQAQGLTHQLLTFSKGGAPVKKIGDVNGLLEKAAVFSVRGTTVRCAFDLAKNLWAAEIDEGQIRQVVGNVLINAHQAMPNGGTVFIHTENMTVGSRGELPLPPGNYIKIVVKDRVWGFRKRICPISLIPILPQSRKAAGWGWPSPIPSFTDTAAISRRRRPMGKAPLSPFICLHCSGLRLPPRWKKRPAIKAWGRFWSWTIRNRSCGWSPEY